MKHKKIKRPLLPAFIFTAAGVVVELTAVSLQVVIALAAAGTALTVIYYLFWKKRWCRSLFIQILIFIFLFLNGYFITLFHDISDDKVRSRQGLLTAEADKVLLGDYSTRIMLSHCELDGEKMMNGVVLEISQQDGTLAEFGRGDIITAEVVMTEAAAPTNPGQFDSGAYYKSQGYGFYIKKPVILSVVHRKNIVIDTLENVKKKLKGVYEACCDHADAGVYEAMVLGDKSDMDNNLKNLFSAAGIGHILAISGLHVSLIGMGLYRLLRRMGAVFPVAAAISGVLVVLYGVMTGSSVSSVRAIVMFCCAVYAQVIGRTYDILSAVSLAGIIILCGNPYIVADAGFLLSFMAIAGVSVVSEGFTVKKLKWITGPTAIWLATLPVMLWFYYEIPLYSILLNLAVVPMMSLIMISALLCGSVGIASMAAGSFFAGIGHYILLLFRYGCEIVLSVPGSILVAGRPKLWQVILYYLFLILFSTRKNIVRFVRRFIENRCRSYTASMCRIWERIVGMLVRLLAVPALIIIFMRVRRGLEAVFLDVGQGDAIFLGLPDGCNIFIDGGSSSQNGIYDKILEPFFKYKGVRNIDFLFITHSDEDHYNGWSGAAEQLGDDALTYIPSIANVVLNESDYEKVMESLKGNATENGVVSAIWNAAGNSCDVSADAKFVNTFRWISEDVFCDYAGIVYRMGGCTLTSLNDCNDIHGTESENDNSIVLLLKYNGYSILFTGDVTSEKERIIAGRIGECGVSEVTLLKAGHHGSRYSTSEDFLESISPKAAVISCASKNSYGHPHKQTLERLEASKTVVYRTDECGAVTVRIDEDGGRMEVYTGK